MAHPRKRSKKLCTGKLVSWTPKWVEDSCDECGQVTGRHDAAIPDFHTGGVRRRWYEHPRLGRIEGHFCVGCGKEFDPTMALLNDACDRAYSPEYFAKLLEETAPFYTYLLGAKS